MAQDPMQDKTKLTDAEWEAIVKHLKAIPRVYIGSYIKCRHFLDAVLWILRVGGQWRSLPPERGKWSRVFKRFSRWCQHGIWEDLHARFAQDADLQDVSIDSSVIRAQACAAGAKGSNGKAEALGRSRGGFGSKIHTAVDALGLPVRFILTPSQSADVTQAIPLMEGRPAGACLADKAYDSDAFVEWLGDRSIKVVIPPKLNRTHPRHGDWWHYKERPVVECLFGKLKYDCRIATRYEKKAINFMGMLSLAAVLLWSG